MVLFVIVSLPATIVVNVFSVIYWFPPMQWIVPIEVTHKVAIFLSILSGAVNFLLYCLAGAKFRQKLLGPVSQKILSPLVILSMEKTMVTNVISELKSVSRLKIFPETEPC